MPNTREKLIELVGQVQDCGCDVTDVVAMNYVENSVLVDHLIANGVVISNSETTTKWIPVTERLPQKEDAKVIDGYIIAILKGRKPNLMKWNEVAAYPHYFTHWMHLPEPPKGE